MISQQIDTSLIHACIHPTGILVGEQGYWLETNLALESIMERTKLDFERFKSALLPENEESCQLEFESYSWQALPVPGQVNTWLVQSWPTAERNSKTILPIQQEVFHRVKNNMAMIESLLYLQKMLTKDEVITSILDDCEKRIHSMILVHVNLCNTLESDVVNMQQYLEQLIRYLINSFGTLGGYSIRTNYAKVELPSDKAVAVGLIVNELVTNSFKYGLKHTYNPTLEISFTAVEEGIELVVADNGPGFEKLPGNEDNKSLGLMLVRMLCRDLNGKLILANKNGARASLVFPQN